MVQTDVIIGPSTKDILLLVCSGDWTERRAANALGISVGELQTVRAIALDQARVHAEAREQEA